LLSRGRVAQTVLGRAHEPPAPRLRQWCAAHCRGRETRPLQRAARRPSRPIRPSRLVGPAAGRGERRRGNPVETSRGVDASAQPVVVADHLARSTMYRSVPVPAPTDLVITNARIVPVADANGNRAEAIESGSLIVRDGRIAELVTGAVETANLAPDTEIIDADGRWVLPGFIEAHGHLGVHEDGEGWSGDDTNEMTDPNGAGLRAVDGIDPTDLGFKDALRGGVTSALIKPGSGNPIGGRTAFVKTWGRIVDEMLVTEDLSVKSALGENPKRVYGEK